VTADDSNGSRIRNPVPPPSAVGKTEESVVWWGAVSKFSEGHSRFYPGFSKTENMWIVGVDGI